MAMLDPNLLGLLGESPARVVFGDVHDERVQEALTRIVAQGRIRPVAVPPPVPVDLPAGVEMLDVDDPEWTERVVAEYRNGPRAPASDADARATLVANPLLRAALYVRLGGAEAAISGSTATSADVLRPAILGMGTREPGGLVSAAFLLQGEREVLTFADCAVVPDPTVEQLAQIAQDASDVHATATGTPSRTAMLSFSSNGSAKHARIDKVTAALALVRERRPDLLIDGEMQLDCALVPEIGARKFPGSPVAGQANVLIFPDLDSGNIGYKMAERLGGRRAIGSVVMGLTKPLIDLSRGCSVRDIVDGATLAACLGRARAAR